MGLLFAALSFVGFLALEKNFKSEIKFLIVQEQAGSQDYYSLSKSAEYLGKIMGEAIHSELFIQEVLKSEKVNDEFLPFDKKERMKEWAKMVKVSKNYQLGTIETTIYSDGSKEIQGLSEAIIEVLTQKNSLFRSGSQGIEVRVLSGPIIEKNPTIANIALIMLAGFLLGVLVSILWVYYSWGGFTGNQGRTTFHNIPRTSGSIAMNPAEYLESLKDIDLNR